MIIIAFVLRNIFCKKNQQYQLNAISKHILVELIKFIIRKRYLNFERENQVTLLVISGIKILIALNSKTTL